MCNTENGMELLVAHFEGGLNLMVSDDRNEFIWIWVDDKNVQTDASYTHYALDPEWNTKCEGLIKELFTEGKHILDAIQKFNARPDILRPVINSDRTQLGDGFYDVNSIYVTEATFAAA